MFEIVEAIHKAIGTESTLVFVLVISVLFGAGGGGMAWLVDRGYKNSPEYAALHKAPTISVEWHIFGNAPTIPTSGHLSVAYLWPLPTSDVGGGLAEMGGLPGSKLTLSSSMRNFQCVLTNYSADTTFNVTISLHVKFMEVKRAKDSPTLQSGAVILERDWPITIPKIDVGPSYEFVFYIVNQSNLFVEVTFPNSATGQIGDDSAQQQIKIIQQMSVPIFLTPSEETKK